MFFNWILSLNKMSLVFILGGLDDLPLRLDINVEVLSLPNCYEPRFCMDPIVIFEFSEALLWLREFLSTYWHSLYRLYSIAIAPGLISSIFFLPIISITLAHCLKRLLSYNHFGLSGTLKITPNSEEVDTIKLIMKIGIVSLLIYL